MGRHNTWDKQKILAMRDGGMTYQAIADELGCTRQYVGQVCGKYNPGQFRLIKQHECIYPNLRRWMNENKVSRKELVRRSGCYESTSSSAHLSNIMRGVTEPSKPIIDKLIEATGLPYDVLFSEVEYTAVNAVPARQYNELLSRYNQLLDAADAFCDVYMDHRRYYSYEMEDE